MIIAIDGHLASGKGTLAKALAKLMGFDHLDTGLLYRAIGHQMIESGRYIGDVETATMIARQLQFDQMDHPSLRTEAVGKAASTVSSYPGVRVALLQFQRDFADNPPGGRGAILDGRDIGTVICPQADLKLFVTATEECRARRRHIQRQLAGEVVKLDAVLADLRWRDGQDSSRPIAPSLPADDAIIVDTTDLSVSQVVAQAHMAARAVQLHITRNSPYLNQATAGISAP